MAGPYDVGKTKLFWERKEALRRAEAIRAAGVTITTAPGTITMTSTTVSDTYVPHPYLSPLSNRSWWEQPPQQYTCTIRLIDLTTKRVTMNAYQSSVLVVPVTLIRTWEGVYQQINDEVKLLTEIPEELARHVPELREASLSATKAERPQEGVYGSYDDEAGF